jgi:hypothetical protein
MDFLSPRACLFNREERGDQRRGDLDGGQQTMTRSVCPMPEVWVTAVRNFPTTFHSKECPQELGSQLLQSHVTGAAKVRGSRRVKPGRGQHSGRKVKVVWWQRLAGRTCVR